MVVLTGRPSAIDRCCSCLHSVNCCCDYLPKLIGSAKANGSRDEQKSTNEIKRHDGYSDLIASFDDVSRAAQRIKGRFGEGFARNVEGHICRVEHHSGRQEDGNAG